jgi:hypothetical protein
LLAALLAAPLLQAETTSFVRVVDGKNLEKITELDPGQGRCFSLPYEKAGKQPVFDHRRDVVYSCVSRVICDPPVRR